MTCERVEEQLSALIDNELDPEAKAEVLGHFRDCRPCARAYEELKLLVSASAELEPLAPPDRLFLDIRRQGRGLQRQPWVTWKQIGWVLVPAAATVVLMLVALPRSPAPGRQKAKIPVPEPTVATVQPEAEEPLVTAPTPEVRMVSSRPRSRAGSVMTRTLPSPKNRAPVPVPVVTVVSQQPTADAITSLRDIQQALEEIEAALHRNPGNPQVLNAYRVTYQKAEQLKDRYLLGAR